MTSVALVLTMWTIYDGPRDAPDLVVVRGQDILRGFPAPVPHSKGYLFRTVADARAWLAIQHPEAGVCIERSADDEPQIVETWL